MQLFLDSANIEQVKEANSWGVIDGVTTNPSLIAKEGKDFKETVREICSIVDGAISAEVLCTDDSQKMAAEAEKLVQIHKNVVIKIPLNSEGLKAIKQLSKKGIRTNATLVFSVNQALLAAKAGASFVSPFIGRLDDVGQEGMQLIRDTVQVFRAYNLKCKIIVASIRHPMHVAEAAKLGADIATVPFDVLQKMIKHPLTEKGIQAFLEDAKKTSQKI
ncbi:MAG: fructose-6-phosphate aldolase [Candidatus ainarchaeum sp.]|nr:fructose-6-phosphate aldolase [Candidatus ainarchaeum sp.]